ncbi:MAG: PatB family C-S lyase [Spirochaetaceae bacterium]|nr:PatB family C-S lyase [Spirochaetaceae bacterium]
MRPDATGTAFDAVENSAFDAVSGDIFDRAIDRRLSGSLKWNGRGMARDGREILPLWVADMDFAAPPAVAAAVAARAAHPIYGYAAATEGMFEAFALWMKSRHGVDVEREWLVFAPGVVPALAFSLRAFSSPGQGVAFASPAYQPFFNLTTRNARKVEASPLRLDSGGRYRMDLEDLGRRLGPETPLMLLCSPHNPTGRVWEPGELEDLASLAADKGTIVVSDEIHSDLVLGSARHVPALALGGRAGERLRSRLVSLYAPSKTFNIAGLQASFAVIPDPGLRASFVAEMEGAGIELPNVFAARAAEVAYREGGPWLAALLDYLRGNRELLGSFIAERLPALSACPTEGTYLAWIDFRRSGLPGVEARGALHRFLTEEAALWLSEGCQYGPGGEGFARLNFGCPRAVLRDALERLEAALGRGSAGA